MFAKITKRKSKNSTSKYLQLVEGYRDGGRVRQRLVASLGPLDSPKTELAVQRLQKSLARLFPEKGIYIQLSEIENEEVFEFGALWALTHLWHKLGLEDLVARAQLRSGKKIGFDLARVVRRLVFNRCLDPLSRLGVVEQWAPEQIFAAHEAPTPYQHWLRALGYVNGAKREIEQCFHNHAVDLFNQPSEILFYDLTSSYFEGTQAEEAAYGFSREHRPDKVQIVIGVVTTKNGLPVGLQVFPGNTADKTTLKDMAAQMKKRFGLSRTTFVGDRGLLSEANCYEILNMDGDFVMALPQRSSRSMVAELVGKKPPQTWAVLPGQKEPEEGEQDLRQRFHEEVIEQTFRAKKPDPVPDGSQPKRSSKTVRVRRVFVYNPEKANHDRAFRDQQIEKTEKRLAEINAMALRAKPERQEEMTRKVGLALARHKTKRLIKATVVTCGRGKKQNLEVRWERLQEVIEKDACHDGIFTAMASLAAQKLDAPETVRTYKNLIRVEWAFRHLKSQIDMRPIFVRSDGHIKGHVLICFIAYYLHRAIELILEQAGENLSAQKALRELSRIKAVKNNAGNITFYGSTRPSELSQRLLSLLEIALPHRILKPEALDFM